MEEREEEEKRALRAGVQVVSCWVIFQSFAPRPAHCSPSILLPLLSYPSICCCDEPWSQQEMEIIWKSAVAKER